MLSDGIVKLAAADEAGRLVRIDTAWSAYNGTLPKPLKVTKQVDDNVQLPLAQVIVDKGRSFLFGEALAFTVRDDNQPAQSWLDRTWEANDQASLLQNLALNGGVAGHGFLKLTEPAAPTGLPRIMVMDPATVRVVWNQDDISRVERYVVQWSCIIDGKAASRRQLVDRDNAFWLITDQVSVGDSAEWVTIDQAPWRRAYPPIADCQNLPAPNVYYGASDLEGPVLANIENLDRVLSNASRILRFHAHPKTIGKGFTRKEDVTTNADGILFTPEGSEIYNLEMASDLASSFKMADVLMDALYTAARIPAVARGNLDAAGAMSGTALHILYQPIIEKTHDKRRLYGDMLNNVCRRILDMGGFPSAEVDITWPEIVPTNPTEDAATAESLQRVGVSTHTLLANMGYDPDQEEAFNADAAAMAPQLPTLPLA